MIRDDNEDARQELRLAVEQERERVWKRWTREGRRHEWAERYAVRRELRATQSASEVH